MYLQIVSHDFFYEHIYTLSMTILFINALGMTISVFLQLKPHTSLNLYEV